jgi:hypothetical protein
LGNSIKSALPSKEEVASRESKRPLVKNLGYEYSKFSGDWGFSTLLTFDGAAGYKFPFYADSTDLVFGTVLDFLAGGISNVKFGLWLFNLNFYVELQGY